MTCLNYKSYCFFDITGAREFVGASRKTGPDDLFNSTIAGFGSGAILGRLQGEIYGSISCVCACQHVFVPGYVFFLLVIDLVSHSKSILVRFELLVLFEIHYI